MKIQQTITQDEVEIEGLGHRNLANLAEALVDNTPTLRDERQAQLKSIEDKLAYLEELLKAQGVR